MEAVPTDANIRYEYVHRVVGNVESRLQGLDERIAQYRAVLLANSQHEKARYDLALDLFQRGEDDEAIALLRGLVQSSDAEHSKTYSERLDSFLKTRSTSAQVVEPVKFSGDVSRGESFEREFGNGLILRLQWNGVDYSGWSIEVLPKDSPSPVDFAQAFTLNFHGPPRLIGRYGTVARNTFRFVPTQADYDRTSRDAQVVLGRGPLPAGKTYDQARDEALDDMDHVPNCTGVLRILDHSGAPAPDTNEVFESFKFEVELCSAERW